MFETFEHTADIGIRVGADDLAGLLAEAGRALFSLIVADLATVRPEEEICFRIDGEDPTYLLVDWLNELLFTFETRRMLLVEFEVQVDAHGLAATGRGETLDRARHETDHEIKAITYHGLLVEHDAGRWVAEVVLDL